TYTWLAPPLAALLIQAWRDDRPIWERAIVLASYALLVLAQAANWFPFGTRFHSVGPQPLAGLIFFTYELARAFRSGAWKRPDTSTPTAVSRSPVPTHRAA